jgi:hypothetical protein
MGTERPLGLTNTKTVDRAPFFDALIRIKGIIVYVYSIQSRTILMQNKVEPNGPIKEIVQCDLKKSWKKIHKDGLTRFKGLIFDGFINPKFLIIRNEFFFIRMYVIFALYINFDFL